MKFHQLSSWQTPVTHYPRGKVGAAEIRTVYYTKGVYEAYMTGPDGLKLQYYEITRRLNITVLKINKKTWMVDDPPHYWAMIEHAKQYTGQVLVAGLGLGLIVHELDKNSAVTKTVVVERSADVIGAIGPHIPSQKLEIVHEDWYDYQPSFEPDGVFFDLFVGDARELYPAALREMIQMRQRFPAAKVFRIHGFANDQLNQIGDAIQGVTRC